MILDLDLASDSFREDPFLENPCLVGPLPVDPFLVVVHHLLEDPFQAPCHAEEAPLDQDPFPVAHSVTQSWDQTEVCQMVGHYVAGVVLASFLVAVDLAYQVVDHALESLALLGLAPDQALVHETLEVVLC